MRIRLYDKRRTCLLETSGVQLLYLMSDVVTGIHPPPGEEIYVEATNHLQCVQDTETIPVNGGVVNTGQHAQRAQGNRNEPVPEPNRDDPYP